MRIWDLEPRILCRQHLLGEHRELHAIWNILTKGLKGYSHHPETMRWCGKLCALYKRHLKLVAEMKRRGYNHASPLDKRLAVGSGVQREFVHSIPEQEAILLAKNCECKIPARCRDFVDRA